MRPINCLKLATLALGLVLPAFTSAQGWIKYVSERDQFLVNFPGEPQIRELDYISESGVPIPSRVYSVEDGARRFAITVVDYTVAADAHAERCRQLRAELDRVSPNQCRGRGHLRDIDGAIAYEAWNIRQRSDGEITYDAFGRVDGIPGHQIQIVAPDGARSFIGLYMLDRKLYVLEGTVPGDDPPPGLFQQSLGLLDEQGRRIRYEGDAEGNYARVQARYEYVGDEDPITGEASLGVAGDEDRIRAPGERTGTWLPEEARTDLAFVNASLEGADDAAQMREGLVEFLTISEFAWSQHEAGIIDAVTLEAYLEPAARVFASEQAQAQWRDGVYSGDPGFMAFIDNWLDELAANR